MCTGNAATAAVMRAKSLSQLTSELSVALNTDSYGPLNLPGVKRHSKIIFVLSFGIYTKDKKEFKLVLVQC